MRHGLNDLIRDDTWAYAEETRRFTAARGARSGPVSFADLEIARAQRNAQPVAPDPAARVLVARADGREVPVRVLAPGSGSARGIYLDIHGGGFYMDSAVRSDARNRRLADSLGVVVVSVDYRLAPENPWPAAPDDCATAALWLLDDGESCFGTSRLIVGGQSAGATLATTTLLRLRDRGLAGGFLGAALQFGTYDLSATTPAGRLIGDEYFLTAYVGHVSDRTVPDISPVFGDLRALPPTLLVVGSEDILLDDNLAMADRLAAAGNDVDLRIYPEAPHGFTGHPTAMAGAALRDIEEWAATLLA
ncbi:alpha/beta hydrolase fold domain-containing protein [Gordonia sp. NPDC003424]